MKTPSMLILLFLLLAACAPVTTPLPTSPISAMTVIATSQPVETGTSPPPTATASAIPSPSPEMSPSPRPTINVVMTPDAVQIERWKEYEEALAIAIFPQKYYPQSPNEVLCDWELLGRSAQDVYVWTVCVNTIPTGNGELFPRAWTLAVIHLRTDESVKSAAIPREGGSHYADAIRKMFPPDVQERYFNEMMNTETLTEHLSWRQEHPEEPPLIVLSATSMP